jgi:glucosamine--fructose-6-phosphate aminotransferase (isomerizing)
MCGIFAYVNHGVACKRSDIASKLIGGLKRLEYRGYDSAGIALDGDGFEQCASAPTG